MLLHQQLTTLAVFMVQDLFMEIIQFNNSFEKMKISLNGGLLMSLICLLVCASLLCRFVFASFSICAQLCCPDSCCLWMCTLLLTSSVGRPALGSISLLSVAVPLTQAFDATCRGRGSQPNIGRRTNHSSQILWKSPSLGLESLSCGEFSLHLAEINN